MLQFANPALQVELHVPPEQVAAATLVVEQARPHAPQLSFEMATCVSHPLASGAVVSQFV